MITIEHDNHIYEIIDKINKDLEKFNLCLVKSKGHHEGVVNYEIVEKAPKSA